MEDLAGLIQQNWPERSQSGIVYCLARKETEEVAAQLNSRGISAVCYHAQMETPSRLAAHRGWAAGRAQIIVATVCFGMGINKTDVRFVVHHTISKSIETCEPHRLRCAACAASLAWQLTRAARTYYAATTRRACSVGRAVASRRCRRKRKRRCRRRRV
jgi:hypothetical protein